MTLNNELISVSSHDVLHNCRLKQYPGGEWEMMVASRPIFRDPGWESPRADEQREDARRRREIERDLREIGWVEPVEPSAPTAANIERAARRAAASVRDIALCNDFKWFVTLTLDQTRIDRYDMREITKKLNMWLDNQVRRCGLRYVLVPERHQDGAIHFHGFASDIPGAFVPSGTWIVPGHKKPIRPRSKKQAVSWASRKDCHEVFNWIGWKYGFSTAIKLYGEYSHAVSYVCKYIRKQVNGGKIGGRWYYSGGDLAYPEKILTDYQQEDLIAQRAYTFSVPEAKLKISILRGGKNHEEKETKMGAAEAAEAAEAAKAAED